MSVEVEFTDLVRTISPKLDRPIVLVGLMGAGKSRIGKMLSSTLEIPFVDSDSEIQKAADCTIPEIFEKYGEAFFRNAECRVIKRLISDEVKVIATGGGTFVNPTTAELINSNAISVWLRADPMLLAKRVSGSKERPLLNGGDPKEIMTRLANERYPLYEKAHLVIDSLDVPHDVTLTAILEKLDGYLNRG